MFKLCYDNTFEESYFKLLIRTSPEEFENFIRNLLYILSVIDRNKYSKIIIKPIFFEIFEHVTQYYWLCLCDIYGEIDKTNIKKSYVLVNKADLLTRHLKDIIYKVFPSNWEYSDKPILSLREVNF